MKLDFTDRTALVTGATHGIGLAVARLLAEAGAHVLVNSENGAACRKVVSALEADGLKATALEADIGDTVALHDMAERALKVSSQLDALFCNAGITGSKRPGDAGYEEDVERVFAINLHHARRLCERLVPEMAAAGGGSVVLTSSLSGLRGNRDIGVYSLTKAAVNQLARDLAVRWGPEGVRVNAISPGLIATGWERQILKDPEATKRRLQMTPLRRIGQPEEVAAAALFLASDAASFITGHTLVVDGGTLVTDGN